MAETATGLRERTRRAVQAELMTVVLDLFLTQGYDATTVDQIAAAAGLSRRSFFRYFPGKDALLAEVLRATGEQIAGAVADRPGGEAPWTTLRYAFDPLVAAMTEDSRALPLTRMMLRNSALQASHAQKQASWGDAIAAQLAPRLSGELPDHVRRLQASALSGAALACLVSAQAEWVATDGRSSLAQLLDLAMAAVSS